ncbi:MAG: 2-5 ligase [Myxococcales bacterium]|nr:2-5 ligase [Myxococcales bacterium]
MTEGKRLFLGVRVSVATANQLTACAEQLARRSKDAGVEIKWVAPANYHVTLKFLGWTREATVTPLRDALDAALAGVARVSFRTTRLGAFPSLEKGSVLWAGIEDGGGLTEVAKRIEAAAVGLGFVSEPRPFHPHVTIGRLRETRAIRDVVLPLAEQMFGDTRIDGVTMFESETKASGSVYREVHRIAFKTAPIREKSASERQTGVVDTGDETDDGWPRGHGGF